MKIKNKKFFTKKKIIIIVIILALVAAGGGYYYYYTQQHANKTGAGGINLNPPTEEDKKRSEAHKQQIDEQETERNKDTSSNGKTTVKPIITYAGQYDSQVEVGAYISSIYEDGGTCELTLTKGPASVKTSVTALKDAGKVNCPVMTVANSKLSSGTWQAVVTYSSNSAYGSSDSHSVEVQ